MGACRNFRRGGESQKMPPLPTKTKIKAPHMVKKALLKEKKQHKDPYNCTEGKSRKGLQVQR